MADPGVDLLSGDLYGDTAQQTYAWMRRNAPMYFDEANGLWGVATYDGVLAASRDPATFSNAGGTRPNTGPLPWMIDMDGADHAKRRKIVSRAFTPVRVRAGAAAIERHCDELIDRVCEQGECDLVRDLAAPLPMIVIGDMLGVPPDDRDELLHWSDALLGALSGEPERIEAAAEAFVAYGEYSRRMIAARRQKPADDLVSVLVHAEVDGDRLDDDELSFEALLLLVGGDESTRHVISGGVEQLLRNPDQRRTLVEATSALLPGAVEEMLRWVTPVKDMTRTVTTDVELEGSMLRAGDKVLLLYQSANFDESHFDRPETFDIQRSPNDHLAFGFGAHFCLGASLGRLEIQTMVDRLLCRLPDLELIDDQPSPRFLGALTALPVRFSPASRIGG
jgi:cytochrome P450 family 142 subfamily A polypeptide 1